VTTVLVATTGGHLAQLFGLAERIPPDPDAVWVTHANEQSTSLLQGRDVEYVPYVGQKDVPGVLRCMLHAHRLFRRRRPTRAVSTGSGIALGYLPYLAARGVECHYIESAARVGGPSLTGRILRWVPRVHTYTQSQSWSGGPWRYGGNGFDAYEAVPAQREPGERGKGVGKEVGKEVVMGRPVEVLWQTGCTPVDDLPITATPFLPAADLTRALAEADIVVSHAGTGSALANLAAGRFAVMVSREAEFGEAGDDHQRELADELAARGLALHRGPADITVDDLVATLSTAVRTASEVPPFELRR
jgi:UDP-N-acetylglucosamine transferase subunit ALG13